MWVQRAVKRKQQAIDKLELALELIHSIWGLVPVIKIKAVVDPLMSVSRSAIHINRSSNKNLWKTVEAAAATSSSTHMHVWYVVMLAYYDTIHTQLLIFYIKTLHWHYKMWSKFLLCSFRALTKAVNATWAELPGLRCCTDCSLLYYDDINSYFSIPDIPVQLELQLWLDFPQEQLNF